MTEGKKALMLYLIGGIGAFFLISALGASYNKELRRERERER